MKHWEVARGFSYPRLKSVRNKLRNHQHIDRSEYDTIRHEAGERIAPSSMPDDVWDALLKAKNPIVIEVEDAEQEDATSDD